MRVKHYCEIIQDMVDCNTPIAFAISDCVFLALHMFSITFLSSYVRRRYFGFGIVLFLVEKHLLYIP